MGTFGHIPNETYQETVRRVAAVREKRLAEVFAENEKLRLQLVKAESDLRDWQDSSEAYRHDFENAKRQLLKAQSLIEAGDDLYSASLHIPAPDLTKGQKQALEEYAIRSNEYRISEIEAPALTSAQDRIDGSVRLGPLPDDGQNGAAVGLSKGPATATNSSLTDEQGSSK